MNLLTLEVWACIFTLGFCCGGLFTAWQANRGLDRIQQALDDIDD